MCTYIRLRIQMCMNACACNTGLKTLGQVQGSLSSKCMCVLMHGVLIEYADPPKCVLQATYNTIVMHVACPHTPGHNKHLPLPALLLLPSWQPCLATSLESREFWCSWWCQVVNTIEYRWAKNKACYKEKNKTISTFVTTTTSTQPRRVLIPNNSKNTSTNRHVLRRGGNRGYGLV